MKKKRERTEKGRIEAILGRRVRVSKESEVE